MCSAVVKSAVDSTAESAIVVDKKETVNATSFDYSATYYKCVGQNCNNFKYHVGLNEDPLPWNPQGSCQPGGLYFTDIAGLHGFLNFGFQVAVIRVPDGTPVYCESMISFASYHVTRKWKAPRLEVLEIIELCEFNKRINGSNKYLKGQSLPIESIYRREIITADMAKEIVDNHWKNVFALEYLDHLGLLSLPSLYWRAILLKSADQLPAKYLNSSCVEQLTQLPNSMPLLVELYNQMYKYRDVRYPSIETRVEIVKTIASKYFNVTDVKELCQLSNSNALLSGIYAFVDQSTTVTDEDKEKIRHMITAEQSARRANQTV